MTSFGVCSWCAYFKPRMACALVDRGAVGIDCRTAVRRVGAVSARASGARGRPGLVSCSSLCREPCGADARRSSPAIATVSCGLGKHATARRHSRCRRHLLGLPSTHWKGAAWLAAARRLLRENRLGSGRGFLVFLRHFGNFRWVTNWHVVLTSLRSCPIPCCEVAQ